MYLIYRQRSHDAVLITKKESFFEAKRLASGLGRSTLEQYFVDEERPTRRHPGNRVRLFQTPVGRVTETTPGH